MQRCWKYSIPAQSGLSRGLARNVVAYKAHLAACDMTRRNDLDGRGNLGEEALAEFTQFFLATWNTRCGGGCGCRPDEAAPPGFSGPSSYQYLTYWN